MLPTLTQNVNTCREGCGKVMFMFLHLSVSHSVHSGGGGLPDRDPLDRDPPGQVKSGRYAS